MTIEGLSNDCYCCVFSVKTAYINYLALLEYQTKKVPKGLIKNLQFAD